jgi:PAS domain S-box-containing protein
MAVQLNSSLQVSFRKISRATGMAVFALGCIVLVGWQFEIPALKSGFLGPATMKANSALAFILYGISLWSLQHIYAHRSMRIVANACAAIAVLIAALTLGEYLFDRDFGIDQFLFQNSEVVLGASFPGRMSPATALNFLFLGSAILLRGNRWRNWLSEALTIITLISAGVAVIGYLYDVSSLYQIDVYASMALHTALAFILLSVGIILARPEYELISIFTNEGPAGILARRLLPAAIAIPIALGWLLVTGHGMGFYDTAFGMSLYALSNVIVFSALIWWNARVLYQVEIERERAEEALSASESRFSALFDTMSEGFSISEIIYDEAGRPRDWRYLEVNPAFERHTGLKAADILGRTSLELFPDAEQLWLERYGKVALTGEPAHFEAQFGPLGRWLEVRAYQTEPGRIAVVFFDISERKRVEERIQRLNQELEERVAHRTVQLESANRELEAFSYSVSHDLRAPLRSIDGFSHALLEDYDKLLPPEGHQFLERIRSSAQRMAELIDDMLNLSRVTRMSMKSVPVDLSKLAQDIAAELQRNHPEHSVRLTIAKNLKADGDLNLLQIVLENLINNAWKFTSRQEQAEIEFGSKVENKETIYFVRDNGAGFDMAYADKLFGAFQRLHTMTEFPGTGIGLATVQRIIHRHGGRVWAEGAVGEGATFFFTLPALKPARPEPPPKELDALATRVKEII